MQVCDCVVVQGGGGGIGSVSGGVLQGDGG